MTEGEQPTIGAEGRARDLIARVGNGIEQASGSDVPHSGAVIVGASHGMARHQLRAVGTEGETENHAAEAVQRAKFAASFRVKHLDGNGKPFVEFGALQQKSDGDLLAIGAEANDTGISGRRLT